MRHVTSMEKIRNAYKILVGRNDLEGNIKTDFKQGCKISI